MLPLGDMDERIQERGLRRIDRQGSGRRDERRTHARTRVVSDI